MEYRVGLRPDRATVVGDDGSWERMLLGSFVAGNERSLYGRFVPAERNVPVPLLFAALHVNNLV